MASFKFKNVFLNDYYTLCYKNDFTNHFKFNYVFNDYYFGCKTLEKAEVKMQNTVLNNLIKNNLIKYSNIDLVVGGDLSNQISFTNYNMQYFNIPFLGTYSACATFVENIIILASLLENNFIKNGISLTSSHNLNSEKQFRFPIEYGSYKPIRTTITATGAVGALLARNGKIKIESATVGNVINSTIKDVFDMGGVMAPAAANTIAKHLKDLNRSVDYYDLILTGDLGACGKNILKEILEIKYKIHLKKYNDAGVLLYNMNNEKAKSGASGPTVLPLVLFSKILNQKKYKKILIVGTGSLHTPVMVNQKNTIPSIAHAVSLEVEN